MHSALLCACLSFFQRMKEKEQKQKQFIFTHLYVSMFAFSSTIWNTWKYWVFSQYLKQASIFSISNYDVFGVETKPNENASTHKHHVPKTEYISHSGLLRITRKANVLIRFHRICVDEFTHCWVKILCYCSHTGFRLLWYDRYIDYNNRNKLRSLAEILIDYIKNKHHII